MATRCMLYLLEAIDDGAIRDQFIGLLRTITQSQRPVTPPAWVRAMKLLARAIGAATASHAGGTVEVGNVEGWAPEARLGSRLWLVFGGDALCGRRGVGAVKCLGGKRWTRRADGVMGVYQNGMAA